MNLVMKDQTQKPKVREKAKLFLRAKTSVDKIP